MRRNGKHDNVFSDVVEMTQPFLPDESTESARAIAIDLRERLAKLEQQMLSQYSAMAAYATIAQQSVETARAESRHDLDRSQATMIGLIERVRRDCTDAIVGVRARLDGARATGVDGVADAPPTGPLGLGRLDALEARVEALEHVLEAAMETQRQLTDTVGVLMREKMEREGWLVSSGTPDDLTLH